MTTTAPITSGSAQGSALQRVLSIPELAFQLCAPLEDDIIDLLTLSTVSRHFRSLALAILVQDICIPLSKVESAVALLKNNVDLLEQVRNLRLWDDEVHRRFRHPYHFKPSAAPALRRDTRSAEEQSSCNDEDETSDPKWTRALPLFGMLSECRSTPLPKVDLSLGIANVHSFSSTILKHHRLAHQISAISVLVDHDEKRARLIPARQPWLAVVSEDIEERYNARQAWELQAANSWTKLVETLSTLRSRLYAAESAGLRSFAIEDWTGNACKRPALRPQDCSKLISSLGSDLQELSLNLREDPSSSANSDILFSARWPALRRLELSDDALVRSHSTGNMVAQFFERHADHLEELLLMDASQVFSYAAIEQTFPKLRTLSLTRVREASLYDLLARHPHLVDVAALGINGTAEEEDSSVSISSNFPSGHLPKLCTLRRYHDFSNRFLDHPDDIHITHLEVFPEDHLTIPRAAHWLLSKPQAVASRLTALEIGTWYFSEWGDTYLDLPATIPKLGDLFSSTNFPALVELTLTDVQEGLEGDEDADSETQSLAQLRALLKTLRSARRLRALHIGCPCAALLSSAPPVVINADDAPPELEYVSWTSRIYNVRQVFRVLPVPSTRSSEEDESEAPDKIRLELLPLIFNHRLQRDGRW
ncbi:hypothetical protein V8E36_008854 [Tilletia maclaganii]